MGLAFGARGRGGVSPAAAHYEPGKVVINLTKMNGAGSLAHEWFHAIDNHLAKRVETLGGRKGGPEFITDNAAPGTTSEGLRSEVVDAFIALRNAIAKTDLKKRSLNIDKTRTKAYWATGIELHARAFESYVIGKLQDQSISNDYLANVVDGQVWQMQAELSGLGDSYPYLRDAELEIVRPAFDALFDTIQSRKTDQGVELYQRDMSEPVASVKTFDRIKGDTLPARQKAAIKWYRDNLVGKEVVNAETGMTISFDSSGAKETAQRTGDDTLAMIPALLKILEMGSLVSSEADRKGRQNIKAVHRFRAVVDLDGRSVSVIAIVRERTDGSLHYRLTKDRNVGDRANQPPEETSHKRLEPFPALEGDADTLNIMRDTQNINGVPTSNLADIAATVRDIIKAHGLGQRVSPRVVRGLLSASGVPVLGSYRNGQISVNASAATLPHISVRSTVTNPLVSRLWRGPKAITLVTWHR